MKTRRRRLEVLVVWNDDMVVEETFAEARDVFLGVGEGSLFPLPEGSVAEDRLKLLEVNAQGNVRLLLGSALTGRVFRGGDEDGEAIEELAREHSNVPIRDGEYGVVHVAGVSVFFQWVEAIAPPPRRLWSATADTLASFGLSVFLHLALLLLFFMAERQLPPVDELVIASETVARYHVIRREEPPPAPREEAAPTPVEAPREPVELRPTQPRRTEARPGPAIDARVRELGLLKALSESETHNAVAAVLALPSAAEVLSGVRRIHVADPNTRRTTTLAPRGPSELMRSDDVPIEPPPTERARTARTNAPAEVRLESGRPTVRGAMPPEAISSVIRSNAARIRYCYEVALQREPQLRGRLAVQFRIDGQGAVPSARITESTLRNPRVEGCVVRQIRGLRFPRPTGGEVLVTFPFSFGATR